MVCHDGNVSSDTVGIANIAICGSDLVGGAQCYRRLKKLTQRVV